MVNTGAPVDRDQRRSREKVSSLLDELRPLDLEEQGNAVDPCTHP
jgi:hypothetical protein